MSVVPTWRNPALEINLYRAGPVSQECQGFWAVCQDIGLKRKLRPGPDYPSWATGQRSRMASHLIRRGHNVIVRLEVKYIKPNPQGILIEQFELLQEARRNVLKQDFQPWSINLSEVGEDKGILRFLKLHAKLSVFAFSWGKDPKLLLGSKSRFQA